MHIIAVAQRKGGSGKTTVAVNVAGEVARRGYSVALVDADPQGSAYEWAALRQLRFQVIHQQLVGHRLDAWTQAVLATRSRILVVDTPADLGPTFTAAVTIADVALIPCGPSSLDLAATQQTLDRIRDIKGKRKRPGPEILLIPTRVDPRTLEGQQLGEELEAFGERISNELSYDVAYVRSFTTGECLADFAPGTRADCEMGALVDLLLADLPADRSDQMPVNKRSTGKHAPWRAGRLERS